MRQSGAATHANSCRLILGLVLCGAFRAGQARRAVAEETIARGKALVVAGDCASCHTADPAKPFAGGKRIDTPFGGIYAPNLTPDRETGIGNWSDDDFFRALRYGVAPDGSRYYPAFPYPYFTKLIRDDILAIRAYLGTLEPVRNKAPPPELRFPFNFRVVMRGWNWLFFGPASSCPTSEERGMESRPLSCRGRSAIAAPAIRRRTSSAPTSAIRLLAAAVSTACSRHGSMAPSAAG